MNETLIDSVNVLHNHVLLNENILNYEVFSFSYKYRN